MKQINIAHGEISASEISLGCMRIARLSTKEASILINTALQEGIDFFDHADIYGEGKAEEVFAQAIGMRPGVRDKIFIQTKCGIRQGYYDFSMEHILASVDSSLRKLRTDYVDVLLLHRPDALMVPEEVAEAFAFLYDSGKVKYFGVSNHNSMQIELLNRYLRHEIIINQLQFGIVNSGMIDAGLHVNMKIDSSINRDGSILDYCRLKDITIQAWSPLMVGFFDGVFLGDDRFPELSKTISAMADAKGVPASALAIAWILRHPAKIQAIAGTTNPGRLIDICRASSVELSREEWYKIYASAGNTIP
jgi:predicted oxidoreductase